MPQTLRLFAANGDAVAESPGTLWDLLANAGAAAADLDVAAMTVAVIDGPVMRVQPLGPALATAMDEAARDRTVEALRARAAGYTRLADWLADLPGRDE